MAGNPSLSIYAVKHVSTQCGFRFKGFLKRVVGMITFGGFNILPDLKTGSSNFSHGNIIKIIQYYYFSLTVWKDHLRETDVCNRNTIEIRFGKIRPTDQFKYLEEKIQLNGLDKEEPNDKHYRTINKIEVIYNSKCSILKKEGKMEN